MPSWQASRTRLPDRTTGRPNGHPQGSAAATVRAIVSMSCIVFPNIGGGRNPPMDRNGRARACPTRLYQSRPRHFPSAHADAETARARAFHVNPDMEHVMSKQCKACGNNFDPHPKVPGQIYCSSPECQRERRRRWQQEKRRNDPDYRDNDARQARQWSAEHPDYWKRYRDDNPRYADRNRNLQQARNRQQHELQIANEDDLRSPSPLPCGRYLLSALSADGAANGGAWIVEITVLSSA